jgi:hypothetical protein
MMDWESDFPGRKAMDKKASACPTCGSENVLRRRSWSSVIIVGIVFLIAFFLTGVQDEGVSAGSTALLILLVVPLIVLTALAYSSRNRCLACKAEWK